VALYLHPQYIFMAWCLVKQREKFTFTFIEEEKVRMEESNMERK
jgi:hypothetical protein